MYHLSYGGFAFVGLGLILTRAMMIEGFAC